MSNLNFSDAPRNWEVCLREGCPKGETCMRRLLVARMPKQTVSRPCIMPTAYTDEGCRQYAEAQPVTVAWGMKQLLNGVSPWHFGAMKQELEDYFGSHSTYYRYWNGRYPIGPERQAWIADLLRRYGYTAQPVFDHTETAVYFPELVGN
ncbi:MAG: hypothetical protein IJT19_09755 [Bacteroidaceae bacterium]|nr:hypothetical protein [Bacteroidaceae bacterium]